MARNYTTTRALAWRLRNVLEQIPATGNAGTQSASTAGFIQHSRDAQTFNNFARVVLLEIARRPLKRDEIELAGEEDEEESADALSAMDRLERWLAWRTAQHWQWGPLVHSPQGTYEWDEQAANDARGDHA